MLATLVRKMHFILRKYFLVNTIPYQIHNICRTSLVNMSKLIETEINCNDTIVQIKTNLVPALTDELHKGQCGRIGVIGGSLEYTGAPYFAAISALKVGADLAHVFCQRDAATVIKSYSPELIVHPILDAENAVELIRPWLDRLHVLVIGPGLGRDRKIQNTTTQLIKLCRELSKPLVIDADGLAILNENPQIIYNYPHAILTPNCVEFVRLFTEDQETQSKQIACLGKGVTVLQKGAIDRLHIPSQGIVYLLPKGGSGRRCGGQGDLLCGSLATFLHWCLQSNQKDPYLLAAFGSSYLVKRCNAKAFEKFRRGMLASDMINEIPSQFSQIFERQ